MSEELDKDSVFFEEIEKDSKFCLNCYRETRSYSEPHYTLPDAVTNYVEYEDFINFTYFDDYAFTGRPSIKRSYCECGVVDKVKIRPVDKEEIMNMAQRICDHLHSKDIEFNEDVFFDTVRSQKSNPDKQFNEEKIFEKAIKNAT